MVLRDASASKNENNSLIDLNPLLYLNQMIHFFHENCCKEAEQALKKRNFHVSVPAHNRTNKKQVLKKSNLHVSVPAGAQITILPS